GSDTWAVEVIPGENPKEAFIVHQMLITDSGIHIIENVRTDLMAAEAARTNRATFFFNMTVPRAVGMTGNFVGIDGIRYRGQLCCCLIRRRVSASAGGPRGLSSSSS